MSDQSKSTKPQPLKVGWYYERDGTVVGPVTDARLRYAAKYGHVKPDTLVWREDLEQWIEAANLPLTAAVWNRLPSSPSIEPTSTAIRPIRIPVEADKPPPEETPTATETQSQVTTAEDNTVVEEPLRDAVTDDEAVEPHVDIQMARAIVERTSGQPPPPSIAPSTMTNRPPPLPQPWGVSAKAVALTFVKSPMRLGIGAVCILMVVAALLLLLHPRAQSHHAVGVTPKAPASVQKLPTVPSAAAPNVRAAQAPAPATAPNAATGPTQNNQTPPPSPLPDRLVTVDGPLDASLFMQQLRHSLLIFDEQCWAVYRVPGVKAESNPSVSIEIDVDRAGHVYDATSGKAPKAYRGVGRCIAGRMRGWKFPAAAAGTHAVVTVPKGARLSRDSN